MSEPKFIDKDNISPFHLNIRQLYQEGITKIQGYSADHWTDYNEHDPGVTILEQLVFAITDLCYKMGFDTVDYLVGPNGKLETEKLALYEADEILTTHPVTIDDFRKVIFDRVPDVSNVWIETLPENENQRIPGLYKIYLYLNPAKYYAFQASGATKLEEYQQEQLDLVESIWPSIRNIGEDFSKENLVVLGKLNVFLCAELVVKNASNLEDILAEIIFQIDQYFNPILTMSSLEDLLEEGYTYDQIFEGPKLAHGFIKPEVLNEKKPIRITKAKIVSIISKIEGVRQIERLNIKYKIGDGNEIDAGEVLEVAQIDSTALPRFKFLKEVNESSDTNPQLIRMSSDEEYKILTVKLRKNNSKKYLNIEYDSMIKTLRRRQALHTRVYSSASTSHHTALLPKGEYRDWSNYYSIQNQFPAIYAINQYGLSNHDSNKRQAVAMQLKGYLILFEQLIADFQNQMAHLKDLYSIDRKHLHTSYYPGDLLQSEIKNIEDLFQYEQEEGLDKKEQLGAVMDNMLQKINTIHPHIERKGRLLDYMLSLYGEKFSQHTLGRVGRRVGKTEKEHIGLENKVRMLETLRYFNANSAKAPTMSTSSKLEDVSGFELKLAVLLGLEFNTVLKSDGQSIFSIHQDEHRRISLVPDHKWDKVAPGKVKNIQKLLEEGRLQPVEGLESSTTKQPSEGLVKNYLIGEKIVRSKVGTNIQNYFIYQSNQYQQNYLLIKTQSGGQTEWHIIGVCNDSEEALIVSTKLTQICSEYQKQRFIFLDHIKLRPTAASKQEPIADEDQRDFYGFRATLVFPSWGKKFEDSGYRHLAEDTVKKIAPAHVAVNVLWLDLIKFREFEKVYSVWAGMPDDEYHRESMVHFIKNNSFSQAPS
ncbi:MAG: hypothetical protein ABJF11_03260 [Reichenbachiella sp.]|uniref:hypothetical protein n=1 Tax=Reichenbachiella sp. TaxID=2184521 RepID=UPI003263A941